MRPRPAGADLNDLPLNFRSLDLFSRRVVGWSVSAVNDRELALHALRNAVHSRRLQPGVIHHSDRGSPYASEDYTALLRAHGFVASMSRTGMPDLLSPDGSKIQSNSRA